MMDFIVKKAYAITEEDLGVLPEIGQVDSMYSIFNFLLNLFSYLGWALTFIGLAYTLMMLVYKLSQSDSEEAMADFSNGIKKAVVIVVLGLLSLSLGWLVQFVGGLIGVNVQFVIPTLLK